MATVVRADPHTEKDDGQFEHSCHIRTSKPSAVVKAIPRNQQNVHVSTRSQSSKLHTVTAASGVENSEADVRTTSASEREKENEGTRARPVRGKATQKPKMTTRLPKASVVSQCRLPTHQPTKPQTKAAKPSGTVVPSQRLKETRVGTNTAVPSGIATGRLHIQTMVVTAANARPRPRPSVRVHLKTEIEIPTQQPQVVKTAPYANTRSKKSTTSGSVAEKATATSHTAEEKTTANSDAAGGDKTETAMKTGRYAELPTTDIETKISELTLNPSQEGDGAAAAGRELVPYEPEADIDLTDDPSLCGDYSADIYVYHRQLEEEGHYLVCAKFLDHQQDITNQHRQVLVDWLAQVHYRFHLMQETMLLTVDILDRYLQVQWVVNYIVCPNFVSIGE